MSIRKAEAKWTGNLKGGKGVMKLESGAYEGNYSFSSRFEEGTGTNPEELIGAALAGCFSMALSNELDKAGYPPSSAHTHADVDFRITDNGPALVEITLNNQSEVSGIDEAEFQKIAEGAKQNCPVSKALKGGPVITLNAKLV
ncbi:MAG: OsmC family protein [Balneolales bacterium]